MTTAFAVLMLVIIGLSAWAGRLKARASRSLAERPRLDRW